MNTDLKKLIIVGTGPNAKHVYKLVKFYDLFDVIGFAVDEKYITEDTFQGLPVYPLEKIETIVDTNEVLFFVALLWNRLNADRRDLYLRLKARGLKFANIISPRASIRGTIAGDNCWQREIIPHGQVVGIAVRFYRGGRWHEVTDPGYRLYARVWTDLFYVRRPFLWLRDKAAALLRRLRNRVRKRT